MPERTIHFSSPRLLGCLYCGKESNLRTVEEAFDAQLVTRDAWLQITSTDEASISQIATLFEILQEGRDQGLNIKQGDFDKALKSVLDGQADTLRSLYASATVIKTRRKSIVPKTIGQKKYLQSIFKNDIVFGIGPAGTGKTYLAMAAAVAKLLEGSIERIILSRPAVEAGETLGFLPGDLQEKILPYLRPLYDALHDMMSPADVERLIEKNAIEIAPLAYMRGRTLSNSFVILDEAQNTTPEQMMMFLTRLGEGSQMVITGDLTQIDIPKAKKSGLMEVRKILKSIKGIHFHVFDASDVVRHHLVQRIIAAYDSYREEHPPSAS